MVKKCQKLVKVVCERPLSRIEIIRNEEKNNEKLKSLMEVTKKRALHTLEL